MDLALIETGNGGDLVKKGNSIVMVNGWINMPYIALFGGNPGYPTKPKVAGEQNFDWWGNDLFLKNDPSAQFNSLTEKALMDVALTSAGRAQLQKVITQDLAFMNDFANITVIVTIEGVDRILIEIQVRQPTSANSRVADAYRAYFYVWDATKQELGDFRFEDFNNDFYL